MTSMTQSHVRRGTKPRRKVRRVRPPAGETWWTALDGKRCRPFATLGGVYLQRIRTSKGVTYHLRTKHGKKLDGEVPEWMRHTSDLLMGERSRSSPWSYMKSYVVRVPYCGYTGPVPTAPPQLWVSPGL